MGERVSDMVGDTLAFRAGDGHGGEGRVPTVVVGVICPRANTDIELLRLARTVTHNEAVCAPVSARVVERPRAAGRHRIAVQKDAAARRRGEDLARAPYGLRLVLEQCRVQKPR